MARETLIGKKFIIQQTATSHPAEVWSTAGCSRDFAWADVAVQDSGGNIYPAVHHGPNLYMKVPLGSSSTHIGQKIEVTVIQNPDAVDDVDAVRSVSKGTGRRIRLSSWIVDRIEDLLPTFRVVYNGTTITAPPVTIRRIEEGPVRMRVEWFTRFNETPLWVKGWYDIYDNQELVEMKMVAGWGTIDDGTNQNEIYTLDDLSIAMREQFVLDFGTNLGIGGGWQASDGTYRHIVANPQSWVQNVWVRGQATYVQGAILCRPTDTSLAVGDPRWDNMQHRFEGPVKAIMDPQDWEGHYGVFGHVPWIHNEVSGGADYILNVCRNELAQAKSSWHSPDWVWTYGFAAGSVSNPDPYSGGFSSPNPNGQGGQHDHGHAHGSHIMTNREPALLHHMDMVHGSWWRFSAAYIYNDGSPLRASEHPGLYTWLGLPWGSTGATETLGWSAGHWNDGALPRPRVYPVGFNISHVSWNNPTTMVMLDDNPSAMEWLKIQSEILSVEANEPNVFSNFIPSGSAGYGDSPNGGGWGIGHNGGAYNNETFAQTRGWGRGAFCAASAWKAGVRSNAIRHFVDWILVWCRHADPANNSALDGKPMRPLDFQDWSYGSSIIGIKLWMQSIACGGLWALLDTPGLVTDRGDRDWLATRPDEAAYTCMDHLIRGDAVSGWDPIQVYTWNYGDPWPENLLTAPNQTLLYRNWSGGGFWFQNIPQRLSKQGNARAISFADGHKNSQHTDAHFHCLRREMPNNA